MDGQLTPPGVERAIGALATRQGGVVSRAQLLETGLGEGAIDARVARGRLLVLHRGVYAVGHGAVSRRGSWIAALLCVGPGAVLSHGTAAAVWDLRLARGPIHVSVGGRTGPLRHAGLVVHRPRRLPPDEVTEHDGLAVTTVERTLVDVAARASVRELEKTVAAAERVGVLDAQALGAVLEASVGRRGIGRLRAALGVAGPDTFTRSELEERFLALLRRHRLPLPELNAWIAFGDGEGAEADALWRGSRLIAELDGFATHGTRRAFRDDRRRDRRLKLADYEVLRFTWDDVVDRPADTAAELRQHLAGRGGVT
jgi:Transcriptional regulator, AbiEi antitoxin/Protein of unknown function (DUF559)